MGVFESLLAPVMGLTLGPLAGPLISAGTSLLGGAINAKNERKGIAAQNAYNDPAQIRARAEAAGFNPISFIGPGVGNQTAAASGAYMGAAIADAGMAMADGIANRTKRKQAEQLGALEIENAKLQNKLLQLTLRPKVGGVYAQRETTPTIAAAVGGGNAGQTSAVVAQPSVVGQGSDGSPSAVGSGVTYGLPKVSERAWMTPGRETKVSPTENISGLMHVDNAITGPLTFVGADGEIFMEYIQAPILGVPQVALNWAGRATDAIRRKFPSAGSYDPYHADPADKPAAKSKPLRQPGQTADAYWKKQRVSAWWQ